MFTNINLFRKNIDKISKRISSDIMYYNSIKALSTNLDTINIEGTTLLNIKNLIAKSIMLTDEASAKFNSKNIFERNYTKNESILYNANKGHQPIIMNYQHFL